MALSKEELAEIHEIVGRPISSVEAIVFDTMWSEHCSYKSSKPVLKTLPTEGSEVVLGVGEDSGIVYFDTFDGKRYCIAASHESHNHPSQILPVEGAATGVGGVVRDVYCMGADVIGVLNSLHFGVSNGDDEVQEIADRVVFGVSDYGNPLGVPVLGGETLYHPSYNDNCLVNVAACGLVAEDRIIRSRVPKAAQQEPYDMILIGKSTDATGFGGASFSSATLDEEDDMTNKGAVQVHDPFLKRVVVNAIHAVLDRAHELRIPIGFKDLGAGGISCAASELAVAGGFGVNINLDHVNTVMPGLAPEVIACSETQERFCLAVPQSFSETVLTLFNETFELPKLYHKAGAAVIGEVTLEKRFVMTHKDKVVCDLDVGSITTEVRAERQSKERARVPTEPCGLTLSQSRLQAVTYDILALCNNASKRYIYRCFDNAVRGDTVVYPGEADAVVVTPIEGCDTALAVSIDSNTYGEHDPYLAGAAAVAESIRNIIAVGARPIALTDCLNYGNPEQPHVFHDFEEGVRGISEAAKALSFIPKEAVPIISGNVSFYNESKKGSAVVPSPVIMAMGRMKDYKKALTMQITKQGLILILVAAPKAAFLGTQLADLLEPVEKGQGLGTVPQLDLEREAKQNKVIHASIDAGYGHACHDISEGGLWQAIVEMLLGERARYQVGACLECPDELSIESYLFSENGGYVLALEKEFVDKVFDLAKTYDLNISIIGHTIAQPTIRVLKNKETRVDHALVDLKDAWNHTNKQYIGTRV